MKFLEVSGELQDLFKAILDAKAGVDIEVWLQQYGLGYFGTPSPNETEPEVWRHEQQTHDLYAYAARYGIKQLIDALFPTTIEQLGLVRLWLGDTEHDQLVANLGSGPCTAEILLEQKSVLSTLFPTREYGLENFIDKVEIALREVEARRSDQVIPPSDYRGRAMDVLNDLETLLKLMILFYQNCFWGHDVCLDELFARAVMESQKGLDRTIVAMEWVNTFFENGETSYQRKHRERGVQESKRNLEAEGKLAYVHSLEKNDKLSRDKSALEEKWRILMDTHMALDDQYNQTKDGTLKQESEKIKMEIEELNRQFDLNKSASRRLEEAYIRSIADIDKRIEKLESKDDEMIQSCRARANQLQNQCKRLIGRISPFKDLEISGIRSIKDRYHNSFTHIPTRSLEKLIEIRGLQPVRKLLHDLLALLRDIEIKRVCPATYIVLGNTIDIYGRPAVLCAKLDRRIHHVPFWSMEKMRWLYSWQSITTALETGKAYFILPNSEDRVLFEPAWMASNDLITKLEQILPTIQIDEE